MNRTPRKKIPFPGLIAFFLTTGILSLFFHRPVQIIDALTSEPVPGFGIHSSPWRILFEPFAGPLLYYLRADQPLLEFAMLLLWILALSLVIALARQFLPAGRGDGNLKAGELRSWLKHTPLIVAVWMGLVWLIIFIPLPANTIVNRQENTILVNTHSHTEYSHDGIISTRGLQKWHERNGFDAFFITDHNHHQQTLKTVMDQKRGLLPGEPLILGGEEYSGSNHMTLLGLTRNFITRGLNDRQVIDSAHADGGVVIVAHWFDDERESIPFFLDMGVDGFEIANQATGLSYDRRIFRDITNACTAHGLIMNGAADYHGYGSSCFVWNALEIPGWHQMECDQKRESIMQLLRARDIHRIRVLLYHDRHVFDRSRVVLSPVYNFIGYFRTLGPAQLLSWFLWLILLTVIGYRLAKSIKGRISFRALQGMALASSVFLLTSGTLLRLKAGKLAAFNDIYAEYSTLALLCGSGFLLYVLILIFFEFRKRSSMIYPMKKQ